MAKRTAEKKANERKRKKPKEKKKPTQTKKEPSIESKSNGTKTKQWIRLARAMCFMAQGKTLNWNENGISEWENACKTFQRNYFETHKSCINFEQWTIFFNHHLTSPKSIASCVPSEKCLFHFCYLHLAFYSFFSFVCVFLFFHCLLPSSSSFVFDDFI